MIYSIKLLANNHLAGDLWLAVSSLPPPRHIAQNIGNDGVSFWDLTTVSLHTLSADYSASSGSFFPEMPSHISSRWEYNLLESFTLLEVRSSASSNVVIALARVGTTKIFRNPALSQRSGLVSYLLWKHRIFKILYYLWDRKMSNNEPYNPVYDYNFPMSICVVTPWCLHITSKIIGLAQCFCFQIN